MEAARVQAVHCKPAYTQRVHVGQVHNRAWRVAVLGCHRPSSPIALVEASRIWWDRAYNFDGGRSLPAVAWAATSGRNCPAETPCADFVWYA